MLRVFWLFVALCALSANANAENVGHNSSGNAKPAQGQRQQDAPSQPIIPNSVQRNVERIAGALEHANKKEPSAKEDDRSERNVRAQEKVADYAPLMLFLGVIEIGLTGFGVWLVRRTIRDSRAATEDDIRPYVQIYRCKFQRIPGLFRMIVTIKNSGQTPATFFEVHFKSQAIARTNLAWIIPSEDLTVRRWNALGGSEQMTAGLDRDDFTATAVEVSDSNGAMVFYVLGKVRYGDIWGNIYETEFAYFTRDITQTATYPHSSKALPKQYRKMGRAPGTLRTYERVGRSPA